MGRRQVRKQGSLESSGTTESLLQFISNASQQIQSVLTTVEERRHGNTSSPVPSPTFSLGSPGITTADQEVPCLSPQPNPRRTRIQHGHVQYSEHTRKRRQPSLDDDASDDDCRTTEKKSRPCVWSSDTSPSPSPPLTPVYAERSLRRQEIPPPAYSDVAHQDYLLAATPLYCAPSNASHTTEREMQILMHIQQQQRQQQRRRELEQQQLYYAYQLKQQQEQQDRLRKLQELKRQEQQQRVKEQHLLRQLNEQKQLQLNRQQQQQQLLQQELHQEQQDLLQSSFPNFDDLLLSFMSAEESHLDADALADFIIGGRAAAPVGM